MSVRTNRVPNPSAETATTGYTAVAGTSGTAAITAPTTSTLFGTKVARCTWSVASSAAGGGQYLELDIATEGLAVGDVISAGIFHVLSSIVTRLEFSVEFRTGVATISTSTNATPKVTAAGTTYGTAAAPDASFLLEGLTIPATCTKIRVRVLSVAGTSYANWSIASYLDLDGVQVEKAATLGAYIDGDQGNAYGWTGTEHASTSTVSVPVITLDAIDDAAQSRVDIAGTDLFPTTHHVTVYRVVNGITGTVREAIDLFAVGGFATTDYEAPLGVNVTYQAMQYNTAGDELGLTVAEATIIESTVTILSDPLRPRNTLVIDPTENAGTRPSKPIPGQIHQVGSRMVALVGQQLGITDLNMDFWTDTEADRLAVDELIADAHGLVLIRTPPVGSFKLIPRLLYCFAYNTVPDDVNLSAGSEEVEWLNTVSETSAPELGYGEALVTWQTLIDAYPTWADLQAAHLTWLDVIQNPPEV